MKSFEFTFISNVILVQRYVSLRGSPFAIAPENAKVGKTEDKSAVNCIPLRKDHLGVW